MTLKDRAFKEDHDFIAYQAPPLSIIAVGSYKTPAYQATLEEYEERLRLIENDLKWLLTLPYQKFWCQVVYDSSCQRLIDTYLKLSPRPYDVNKIQSLPNQIITQLNSIHKYIFLTCLRMSTYKESKVFLNYLSSALNLKHSF